MGADQFIFFINKFSIAGKKCKRKSLWSGLLLLTIGFGSYARAAEFIRFQSHLGVGQSVSTSADNGLSYVENPIAFGFAIDTAWSGATFVFAEHMRTMGDGGSSVGLSGGGFKYYPWVNPLQRNSFSENHPEIVSLSVQGYSIYLGGSIGLSQASVPASGTNTAIVALGAYANGKAGVEMFLTPIWSLISEANVAVSIVGSGSVQFFNITLGVGYSL